MKTFSHKQQTLSLFLSLVSTSSALAFECRPEVLNEVLANARATIQLGQRPVVLFDLDDTLIDTRRRTYRIIQELMSDETFRAEFPAVAARLEGLAYSEVRYQLGDTFKGRGIEDQAALERASSFWAARFFTDKYSADDVELSAAASYVQELRRIGAQVVYLTGRDEPRMGRGTRESLVRNGFPTESNEVRLMLKPTAKTDDLEFKRSVFAEVAAMGTVIAAFENEPANLNAMAEAFPGSTPVFLDTIHSPKPDMPGEHTAAVKDYTATGGCSLR